MDIVTIRHKTTPTLAKIKVDEFLKKLPTIKFPNQITAHDVHTSWQNRQVSFRFDTKKAGSRGTPQLGAIRVTDTEVVLIMSAHSLMGATTTADMDQVRTKLKGVFGEYFKEG